MTSQIALEHDKKTQIIMYNEIYNVLNVQKDFSVLMTQALGFIDIIKKKECLLDEEHKKLILLKMIVKIKDSIDKPNIPISVKNRALSFIVENDLIISKAIVDEKECLLVDNDEFIPNMLSRKVSYYSEDKKTCFSNEKEL